LLFIGGYIYSERKGIVMRKAFISPSKYVQGEDEIKNLGYFVQTFGKSALLIAHKDDVARVKDKLDATAKKFDVRFVEGNFGGECSRQEVQRLKKIAKDNSCDCTIGLGGGKAIDAAKCVAEGVNIIIVPTIVATDAATSHSAVLYTENGAFDDYAYFKQSPSVVLVDTTVIANAPVRFLVSGMGDALSTYFEARASAAAYAKVNAGLPCGFREGLTPPAKGTNSALMLATLCYQILMKDELKEKISVENKVVTPALENIIEANSLLSGLGFESGGLAAAHSIHNGLTALDGTHDYYDGEKVAFGTITQLVLENAPLAEIELVIDFCKSVGLPTTLAQLGIKEATPEKLMEVAKASCAEGETIHNMPFAVTPELVYSAIVVANKLGV
jgi:glycerol dehydrogenase